MNSFQILQFIVPEIPVPCHYANRKSCFSDRFRQGCFPLFANGSMRFCTILFPPQLTRFLKKLSLCHGQLAERHGDDDGTVAEHRRPDRSQFL